MNGESTEAALGGFLSGHAPVAEPTSLKPGETISGWTVTGFLGRGGSGEVYRVQATDGKSFAALKILAKENAAARARFTLEEDLLVRRECVSLPRLIARGTWQGRPYFVMELLEPVELPQWEHDIATYMLEICDAVAQLHAHGLVHRDIKPQNVMRREDGRIVLIDLGLAKDADDTRPRDGMSIVSGHVVAVGTPGYAAPEQMQGGVVSPAADIHALGRLANACFKGRPPRTWTAIIRRSTSSIPEQRYGSVGEFAAAIGARNRRRRMAQMLVGACLLFLVALFCWWGGARTAGMAAMENSNRPRHVPHDEERPNNNTVRTNITIRLEGQTRVFKRPLVLAEGVECRIEGPGTFDVTILAASSNATVRLSGCVLLNRSSVPLDKAGIDYFVEDGSYLNFTALDESSNYISRRRHVRLGDGARDAWRFKGPETWGALRQQEAEESMRIIQEGAHRKQRF